MIAAIGRLADHPDMLDELTASFVRDWPEWYGPGGKGNARADLAARMNCNALPLALVATLGAQPVGALTLSPTEIHEHPGFAPSLIGFWVRADLRNRGIGTRLLHAAHEEACRLNIREYFAATEAAAPLFRREGWTERNRFLHEGAPLTAFSRRV